MTARENGRNNYGSHDGYDIPATTAMMVMMTTIINTTMYNGRDNYGGHNSYDGSNSHNNHNCYNS